MGVETTSQINNSLTIMIEGLKSENDEVKEAIQYLNEVFQQAEAKAKDEADANISKSHTIINEFKTDIENKYQNITIQYQDNFDRVVAENQKLKDDLNKLKEDNDTLGEVMETIQSKVDGLAQSTKEKFETSEKNIQEINSYTTNIKLQMENDQENNLELIKTDIEKMKALISDQDKDIGDKMNSFIIKFESDKKELKDGIEKDANDNLAEISKEIGAINENAKGLDQRLVDLANENKNNVEKLISLQEDNFVQKEKVQFVEALGAKVDAFDEERKKSEALLIQKNEELIALNSTAIKDLEKVHNDRLNALEKDNKNAVETTSQINNSLTIMIE